MVDRITPAWVKDAVFYQIFPDRFARSARVPKPSHLQEWGAAPTFHAYQGGDLLGVKEHLDYLVDLGITAIYLNPIFQSASNHRYHTHDYFRVDPMLGGDDALRELLDAAHTRGMRVILDAVLNHSSRGFFQFNDILENGPESAYLDWFTVEEWPLHPYGVGTKANYAAWWSNPALPKFNTNTPAVREFLWRVGRHWIEFGADGWRMDVPEEINDDEFWREFRRQVKGVNPEAYIVGEVWHDAERWLKGDQFDGVMNYGMSRAALGFFGRNSFDHEYRPGGFRVSALVGRSFLQEVDRLIRLYPWQITQSQMNMLDSHDTARFIHQAGGKQDVLRLALLFAMTIPGAPCVYYGTEIGMNGGPDPDCRRAFRWETDTWDCDLHAYTRRLIALRRELEVLRSGTFEAMHSHDDVVAYARRTAAGESGALVVFNASNQTRELSLDLWNLLPDGDYSDRIQGLAARVNSGSLRHMSLPPRTGAVFAAG